jgi:hypothetical protein
MFADVQDTFRYAYVQMSGINIDKRPMLKAREQRIAKRIPQTPHQIGIVREFYDFGRARTMEFCLFESPHGRVVGHRHCREAVETIRRKPLEEVRDEIAILFRITGRRQNFEPEDAMPERLQSERVLQEPHPMTAALWVNGEDGIGKNNEHGVLTRDFHFD